MNKMKHWTNKYRNDDSFQIWFRHYCSFVLNRKWQMKNINFYTLHLDNNLPNIANRYYIHYIGKGIVLEISHFQLNKTLIMKKRKLYKKGQSKRFSLIFGLGNIVRLQVCSYHPGKIKHSIFRTSYHDNKFANTEILINIVWLGNWTMTGKCVFKSSTCRNCS